MISGMLLKIKMYYINYFPIKSTDNKSLAAEKKILENFCCIDYDLDNIGMKYFVRGV